MHVHIIGGGIIGLCTAWYLSEEGVETTVIDRTDMNQGCSYGNAGLIVPSHFLPMASPGVISKGIRWMFDPKSPFYIKPRWSLDLLQWLWLFYRSCRRDKSRAAMPFLRDFHHWSKSLYLDLANELDDSFEVFEKGLLMIFQELQTMQEESRLADLAVEFGIKAQLLSGKQVEELEKGTRVSALGAVYYPGDAHINPNKVMASLMTALKDRGVKFRPCTALEGWVSTGDKIEYLNLDNQEKIKADRVILSAGSWSGKILKIAGLKCPVQPGKGYSITLSEPNEKPNIPSILVEAKAAITPMHSNLRVGGTLSMDNFSGRMHQKRTEALFSSLNRYYPDIEPIQANPSQVWHGFRPCTPDGLPYLGPSDRFSNLFINTGHAMMGVSLGPASGKLMAEIVLGSSTTLDIKLLDPGRFA